MAMIPDWSTVTSKVKMSTQASFGNMGDGSAGPDDAAVFQYRSYMRFVGYKYRSLVKPQSVSASGHLHASHKQT